MRYRALGNSGLVVSVAGLGCNNFGRRLDVAATRAVVDAAIDSGVTLLDTADIYGGSPGLSEEILLGAALPPVPTAARWWWPRSSAWTPAAPNGTPDDGALGSSPLHPAGGRCIVAAARHRLDRPLPAAPTRPRHPHRGDAGRARRADRRRQGAVHRTLQLRGLAVGGRRHRTATTAGHPHFISAQNEYSLLESVPGNRAPAGGGALRRRHPAVLPVGERAALRQHTAAARMPSRAPGCTSAPGT